jgi:hypothetical protein
MSKSNASGCLKTSAIGDKLSKSKPHREPGRTPGLAALALLKTGAMWAMNSIVACLTPNLTYTSDVWADGYTLEDAQNANTI